MIRSFFVIVFSCVALIESVAQIAPVPDHYMLNPVLINPAFAGNRGVLNIAAFYRQQWVGITGAPVTTSIAADAPVMNSKIGVGLIVSRDKIGVTKETSVSTTYSYKINFEEGILSFGLGAGILTTNTAWSELIALDPGDDYFMQDSKVFVVPDFSVGAYYAQNNYFIGFSVPKLLSYKFNPDKNKYTIKARPGQYYYLFNTGYVFHLSDKVRFFPSTLISYSPGEKIIFDLNTHFGFADRFWLGTSLRSTKSLAVFSQFQINDQLRAAYTYNYVFSKLRTYTHGSHEVMLRYEFRPKVQAINPLTF